MAFSSDPSVIDVPAPALSRESVIDDLLNQKDMARWLRMHPNVFRASVRAGHLPAPINLGNGPRWSKAVMLTFIYSKAQEQAQAAQKH